MTANPIDLVGGLATTANVVKADLTAWTKARVPQVLADAAEVRNTVLAAQLMLTLKSTGIQYFLDTSDFTSVDDGVSCIISSDGFRFKPTPDSVLSSREFAPEDYGAKGDTRLINGVTVTASGTAVSCTTAIFKAGDVGKQATIGGCGYQIALGATIQAAGSGYTAFDQLTAQGGTSTETALLVVNTGGGGAVSSFNQFFRLGKYSVKPSNPVSVTGGTGTGATFNLTYRSLAHTSEITAVASDGKSITIADAVVFAITSSVQNVYVGTDDGEAIADCMAAAVAQAANNPVSVRLTGIYNILDRQILPLLTASSRPFSLVGARSNARMHFIQKTGDKWGFVVNPGETVLAASGAITADAAEGDRNISVSASVIASARVGDYFYINSQTAGAQQRAHYPRVTSISGSSVEMSLPMPFSIDHNQPNFINKFNPVENLLISDVVFDGFGTVTDLCAGIALYQVANSCVRNVRCENFWSFNSQACATYELYNCDIDVKSRLSGGGTGADAVELVGSLCNFRISCEESFGFGIGLTLASTNRVDLKSYICKGRSVKLYGACGNTGSVECADDFAGFVGLAFTSASSGNVFSSVRSSNNYQGIWSDGSGNANNTIRAYYYSGNSSADIALAANDSKFNIYACPGPAALVSVDLSTGSTIINGATGSGAQVLATSPTLTSPKLGAASATTAIVGASTTLPAGDTVVISSNPTTLPALSGGAQLHIGGADSGGTVRVLVDGFATNPTADFRRANNTAASPSALAIDNIMMNLVCLGYGATAYSAAARAFLRAAASEAWSDTAQGSYIIFGTTPSTTILTAEAMRLQPSGGLSIGTATDGGSGSLLANGPIKSQSATAGIGYAGGAGGTVTQASSKSTAVTINTVTGTITMNNAALAAATVVAFVLNDSAIAATDYIGTAHESGGTTGAYTINARATGSGTAAIDVRNNTAGSLSEAIVIRFFVHKSVNS